MRLLLVRHGESTWNAQGRYQGRRDAPLSARGIAQARALAEHFAAHPDEAPGAIVTSPLSRARDTAEAVAQRLGERVDVDDRLIEICHGEWEGLLAAEVAARWPDMLAAWRTTPDSVTFPGGESLADVLGRWRAFLKDVAEGAAPLLVITHDVIVRLAVLDARAEPLTAFNSFTAHNAAVTELEYSSGVSHLHRLNMREHLGDYFVDPAAQAL